MERRPFERPEHRELSERLDKQEFVDNELSARLDRMWQEHILACLAIITAWQESQKET